MSALSSAGGNGVENAILDIARPAFARAIWAWFDASKDRVILSKWGFITIRVSAVRWIVEEIAGPEPTATPPTGE